MNQAPELSLAAISKQAAKLVQKKWGDHHFAFFGTGPADEIEVEHASRPLRVVPVMSELELRRHLLAIGDDWAAFLVPWRRLPLDLCGRFAEQRVYAIGKSLELKQMFGAEDFDDDVQRSPLADYLLTHHAGEQFAYRAKLTTDHMWRAWLERWGLDAGGEWALDALLGWAAASARGPEFVREMDERGGAAVREALLGHLGARLGKVAPALWLAWEDGRGREVLELAVLAEAKCGLTDDAVSMWWDMTVSDVLGKDVPAEDAGALSELAGAALRNCAQRLEHASPGGWTERGEAAEVRRIVAAADERVHDRVRGKLTGSTRLPSAWRARLDRLGAALCDGAEAPSAGVAARAYSCYSELRSHQFYADSDQQDTIERAEMALRLLGWLATRADRAAPRSATPYAEAEALSQWYAAEGGYVDWARRWARGTEEGEFGRGLKAVLDAADQTRAELDQTFAEALPAYHEAGRPAQDCVPIDKALERIGGRFLKEREDRRLLVLLMDGMGWAQAAEILSGLGEEMSVWGPLAWHDGKHRVGEATPYPAVLANFPTVTEVSRSAFFAGGPMAAAKDHATSKDPERWEKNKLVREFVDAQTEPRLLLRGEGHTKDGSASEEALSLVADSRRRMVGIVINAIDSSLKGDAAQRIRWNANTIKSLRDLLDAARDAGRAVLFCADHGHVPADLLGPAGMAKKNGARWRVWESADDPVEAFEVGLSAEKDGVWAPRGAHGVVLLKDDTKKYGGGAASGEHGGAALAEVIAPCVLIGCDGAADKDEDRAAEPRPLAVPGWWHFDLGEAVHEAPTEVKAAPVEAPEKAAKDTVTARRRRRTTAQLEPDMGSPFAQSEILKARAPNATALKEAVAAVEFLLSRQGAASAGSFAKAMGEFPNRVRGLVAKLEEVLNVDGFQGIRYDRRTGQVHLCTMDMLEQLFEVKL